MNPAKSTCHRCLVRLATHTVRSFDQDGKPVLVDMPICLECAAAADSWPALALTRIEDGD